MPKYLKIIVTPLNSVCSLMSSKPSMTTAHKPFPLQHSFAASPARAQLPLTSPQWTLSSQTAYPLTYTSSGTMSGGSFLNGIQSNDLRNMTVQPQTSPPVYEDIGNISANFFSSAGQDPTMWTNHSNIGHFSTSANDGALDAHPSNFTLGSFEINSWVEPYQSSSSNNSLPGTPNRYAMGFPAMSSTLQGSSAGLTYHSRTPSQLSPAGSDRLLTLSAPPTPAPLSALLSTSGENASTPTEYSESEKSSPKAMYTHREQYNMFIEATTLPTQNAGQFIPQGIYKPHTNSDRKRYVEEVKLEAPLYFAMEHPSEYGISLQDALHSRVKRLVDREKPVFEGRGPSVSIRLEWPGYRQWTRQIPTKDFRSPPGPITMAKLAKNIAKCVQRFLDENKDRSQEEGANIRWKVGTLPHEIKLEDIILVSLHHVSLGSWQPQLRLRRPSTSS